MDCITAVMAVLFLFFFPLCSNGYPQACHLWLEAKIVRLKLFMGRLIIPEMKKRMIIKLYLFTLPESGNTVGGNYEQFRLTALPSRTSLLNTQPVMWFRKHLQAHTFAQQTMQNVGFVIFLEVLANKAEVNHSSSSFWKHQNADM